MCRSYSALNKNEIKRAVSRNFEGYNINFVSPEDLILSKLLWFQESQSTRQLEDIKSVLAITNVDLKYVRNWAGKHGTIEILNDLLFFMINSFIHFIAISPFPFSIPKLFALAKKYQVIVAWLSINI